MKFSSTVDSLSKENGFFRTVVKVLILGNMLLSLAVLFFARQRAGYRRAVKSRSRNCSHDTIASN
jgi:hypothetical protein